MPNGINTNSLPWHKSICMTFFSIPTILLCISPHPLPHVLCFPQIQTFSIFPSTHHFFSCYISKQVCDILSAQEKISELASIKHTQFSKHVICSRALQRCKNYHFHFVCKETEDKEIVQAHVSDQWCCLA